MAEASCIEAMVPTVDLCAYRSDSFEHHFSYFDEDGIAVDMSGWTARMQIRKSIGSTTIQLSISESDYITLGVGTIDILVPGASMGIDGGVYDLELTDTLGLISTLVRGEFAVTPDTSRD